MSKRVHFAARDIYHSPLPSPAPSNEGLKTPSPTPSDSSVPSTSSSELELSTPPPPPHFFQHPSTPYFQPRNIYLPQVQPAHAQPHELFAEVEPKRIQIHKVLAYAPYTTPPIAFDLTYRPSISPHILPRGTAFSDPATYPPMKAVTILLPVPVTNLRPWEITVEAASGAEFITVIEVLHALHRALRPAVHPHEYEALLPEEAALVNAAYFTRCSRVEGTGRILEEQKGVKRIDLYMGRTRFTGLCMSGERTDVWELTVSLPP